MKNNAFLLNVLLAGVMISFSGCGSDNLDVKNDAAGSAAAVSETSVITTAAGETSAETESTGITTTVISENTKENISEKASSETVTANNKESGSAQQISTESDLQETFKKETYSCDMYLGRWESDRLTMTIEKDADTSGYYIVTVSGANSAEEYFIYKYFCLYDEMKESFMSEFGTLTSEICPEGATEVETNTVDGERAEFILDPTGIIWLDLTEENSGYRVFVR